MNAKDTILAALVGGVIAISHGQTAHGQGKVFRESFDAPKPTASWQAIRGDWTVEDGAYCQRSTAGPGYRYALVTLPFAPDLITVEATPIQKNDYGFASFGLVLEYSDAANWTALRFGSYGSVSLRTRENGEGKVTSLGRFKPELGRTYELALLRRRNRIAVLVDGVLQCALHADRPDGPPRVGVFTESACRFDNFVAHAGGRAGQEYKAGLSERWKRDAAARAARVKATTEVPNGLFCDDFEAPELSLWRHMHGRWRIRGGKLTMTSDRWGRHMTLAPVRFEDGVIEGTATPTAKSAQGRGVFGVVVKWIDSANWIALRYGEYGGVSVLVTVDGKLEVKGVAKFTTKVGRAYRFKAEVQGTRVTAYCDGERLGATDAAFAGKVGRPGLYTEAPATFDGIRVHGALPLPRKTAKRPAGTPRLVSEFTVFRPARTMGDVWNPGQGTACLYVRNKGTGPAEVRRLLIDSADAKYLPTTVAWYRQRPVSLKPGDVGEIAIRFSALPPALSLELLDNPSAALTLPVTIEPYGGEPLRADVPISTKVDPIQINYIAFDQSLKRVFVYVQRNPTEQAPVWHLDELSVNGRDLTGSAVFGQKDLAETVVPIVVDLSKPLQKGQPVVVCVGTREGVWAGHSARAFPGEFHIQATLLGKQTRPDAVEDIHRHGFTCIGLCGASDRRLLEAKALGLKAFHYGRGGLAALRQFDVSKYPAISGFWLDEMDKLALPRTVETISECESAYRKGGKFIPLQMINLIRPRVAQSLDWYELADAVCSAYGFHGAKLGAGFGRLAALPHREYRMARRAFLPYFRDAEMPIVVDPGKKKVIGREPQHRRCMEPKEERWMTYGCLIQGAKGIMHWNYGAGLRKPPNWFSKDKWTIRASLGGALRHNPHGYLIPEDAARDLERVWDEIGRINVELRAVGPLVAVSDVSNLARIVTADPAESPSGEPSVEAAALVSGLDTIVLIVLNHNMKTNWTGNADRGIESYDPVDTTVELRIPPWLQPEHTFSVRHTGVDSVQPEREAGRLVFRFEKLEVSKLVVITEHDGLMGSMRDTAERLRGLLEGD